MAGLSNMALKVYYLPQSPGRFKHSFNVHVGHFELDTIHLYGEAIYPNLSLALPRDHSDQLSGGFTELLDEAVDTVSRRVDSLDPSTTKHKPLLPFHHALLNTGHMPTALANKLSIEDYFRSGYSSVCMT